MSPYYNSHRQTLPTILLSDSFNEGRYNKPWSGGDWNEFQRGQNERRWNENANQDINKRYNKNPGSGGGNSGGGGSDGCGIIVLIALAIAVAIPSAAAALISSIIILVTKNTTASFSNIQTKTKNHDFRTKRYSMRRRSINQIVSVYTI